VEIEQLDTRDFRNLTPQRLSFGRVVVFEGPNGQGKTNLLEALYVCATGKSFRRARPLELVRHGASHARLQADLKRHGVRHSVEVSLKPGHRGLRVDDRALRRASKLLELLNVVAFFPDDLRIIKGSPEERRMFLDRAVANRSPEFVDAVIVYERALRSRNALLRAERLDRALLEAYDEQLIEPAVILQRCRRDSLRAIAPLAQERFGEIMRGLSLELRLLNGLDHDESLDPATFREALRRGFPRDRARGQTLVGPHRADLHVTLSGHAARQFASQGQQRAVVLALKLAEVAALKAEVGTAPILLLDDVSSELDRERTAMLFAQLAALDSQVFVTTTGATTLPLPAEAQRLRVMGGEVQSGPGKPA
jgi:DNA replication and repair protein RecF